VLSVAVLVIVIELYGCDYEYAYEHEVSITIFAPKGPLFSSEVSKKAQPLRESHLPTFCQRNSENSKRIFPGFPIKLVLECFCRGAFGNDKLCFFCFVSLFETKQH
jgi:hypothetical protein